MNNVVTTAGATLQDISTQVDPETGAIIPVTQVGSVVSSFEEITPNVKVLGFSAVHSITVNIISVTNLAGFAYVGAPIPVVFNANSINTRYNQKELVLDEITPVHVGVITMMHPNPLTPPITYDLTVKILANQFNIKAT